MKFNYTRLDSDLTLVYKNFTPPGSLKTITLDRKLTKTDLSDLTEMPGFKVSWYYSGDDELIPYPKYLTQKNTQNLIR